MAQSPTHERHLMTNDQWNQLLAVIRGEQLDTLPVGFIIDSPWLPGWANSTAKTYFDDPGEWLNSNLLAENTFPDVWFLPGFWREFGMCTEPSAFGAEYHWSETSLPHAEKTIDNLDDGIPAKPDVKTAGLGPRLLSDLVAARPTIETAGHQMRFAVARGPLNIASFLMGTTEFLMATKLQPEKTHALLQVITDYLVDWLRFQRETIDSIDGILLLDDIIGFVGEDDFVEFAKPYLTKSFAAFDASVTFLHDDTPNLVPMHHLADIGVNLVNPSHMHSFADMRQAAGDSVTIFNGIAPRDCLASETPEGVYQAVSELLASIDDPQRIILSCGGGMPPDTSTDNLRAFCRAAAEKPFDA